MTDTVTVSRELLRQVIGAMIGVFNGEPITGMPIVKSVSALRAALDAEPLESVPQAMQTVIAAMQADPSYAWSWHCNVAMTYVDAGGDRYTGNQGAARFMKLLANVDPAHELPEKPAPVQEPDAIGCKCSVCGEWQRWTPSGMVCKNGHGGADGVNHRLYTASAERPVQEPETDVRKIMLAVVPGFDGMGAEVYAKSTKDVEDKLSALGSELEEWQLGIRRLPAPVQEPDAFLHEDGNCAGRESGANAKHIATANPPTVIAMCDEIERLQALCNKQAEELMRAHTALYGRGVAHMVKGLMP